MDERGRLIVNKYFQNRSACVKTVGHLQLVSLDGETAFFSCSS
uniref:Uncharacterized protein n=1 Tax=Anguilla anguilla TaxID=7936 RepID=A0A0E9SZU8_ANGAN